MNIFLRNSAFTLLGEITEWNNLDFVIRDNDAGGYQLELPGSTRFADRLLLNAGFIFERDGVAMMSGPIVNVSEKYTNGKLSYLIQGKDDLEYLNRRLCYPAVTPFTASAYDSKTDVGSTVIIYYVNRNLIAGTFGAERNVGITLASDPVVGSSVNAQARFQNLLYFSQLNALRAGDIKFRCIQGSTQSAPVFTVSARTDQSSRVSFSIVSRNLADYQLDQIAPDGNYVICGGGGLTTSRTFSYDGDGTSIADNGRIESFLDRRDSTDTTQLAQAVAGELTAKAEKTSFSMDIINTGTLKYGVDYSLGDTVEVVSNAGVTITDVVREVRFTYKPNQPESIQPVVGSPSAADPRTSSATARLIELENKTNSLEQQ